MQSVPSGLEIQTQVVETSVPEHSTIILGCLSESMFCQESKLLSPLREQSGTSTADHHMQYIVISQVPVTLAFGLCQVLLFCLPRLILYPAAHCFSAGPFLVHMGFSLPSFLPNQQVLYPFLTPTPWL